jgi:hypothetical protein
MNNQELQRIAEYMMQNGFLEEISGCAGYPALTSCASSPDFGSLSHG